MHKKDTNSPYISKALFYASIGITMVFVIGKSPGVENLPIPCGLTPWYSLVVVVMLNIGNLDAVFLEYETCFGAHGYSCDGGFSLVHSQGYIVYYHDTTSTSNGCTC